MSQVDMGCNYRREVSQPLRHVPAMLSTLADVSALGTAKGVTGSYVCSKLLHSHENSFPPMHWMMTLCVCVHMAVHTRSATFV